MATAAIIFGALVSGLIVGAIPAICGGVKGKLGLGIGGLAACVAGSFLLGLFLSIPLCAVFMFLIFKKDNSAQAPYQQPPYQQPGQPPYQQPGQLPYQPPYQQPGQVPYQQPVAYQPPTVPNAQQAAGNTQNAELTEQLKKLSDLKDAGILSDEEFQEKKRTAPFQDAVIVRQRPVVFFDNRSPISAVRQ